MVTSTAQAVSGIRSCGVHPERFCAVGGTSLVTSTRRALATEEPISYFEFCALSEFLDSLLLHDQVVILGTLGPEDEKFLELLRRDLGESTVLVVDTPTSFDDIANRPAVQQVLRSILEDTFGRNAPTLSPVMLNERVRPSRMSDDYKGEVIRTFASFCSQFDGIWRCDYDRLAAYLVDEQLKSLTSADHKFVVNYLFRTFLLAAVAAVHDGSILAEGLRKYVLSLLQARLKRKAPVTLAKRLYEIANAAYRAAMHPLASEYPFVSLGVSRILFDSAERTKVLGATRVLRAHLAPYRESLSNIQKTILNLNCPISERLRAHADLLGSGAAYLRQIVEQLQLRRTGMLGFFEKLWFNSVDSLAGIPKVTASDKIEAEAEMSGTLALSVLRAARRTWLQQKKESEIRLLLSMVQSVATAPGLLTHIADLFPIRNPDNSLIRQYEDSIYVAQFANL